jgi:hypothetical protein
MIEEGSLLVCETSFGVVTKKDRVYAKRHWWQDPCFSQAVNEGWFVSFKKDCKIRSLFVLEDLSESNPVMGKKWKDIHTKINPRLCPYVLGFTLDEVLLFASGEKIPYLISEDRAIGLLRRFYIVAANEAKVVGNAAGREAVKIFKDTWLAMDTFHFNFSDSIREEMSASINALDELIDPGF